jgi:2-dehydrotetronate isomerase
MGCEYRPKVGTRDGLGWIRSTGFSGTMESFET